jgi:phosphate transport system substrate-binding protein
MTSLKPTGIVLAATLVLASGGAMARNQLQIVGSSTVFPFSAAVAEMFGKTTSFKTPVVESTGSGGGMKLFCAGTGENTPDIANASRRIKSREFQNCSKNGVTPVEVKIGFDGIVLANSVDGTQMSLTLRQIYLALAKHTPGPEGKLIANPNKLWSDIDASFPAVKIEILGPPPTSGTRDAFEELAMAGGAKTFSTLQVLRGLKKGDAKIAGIGAELGLPENQFMYDGVTIKGKSIFKKIAYEIREDGAFIEAGENDNLIVQKLTNNPNAIGILGFSFLDQNSDKIQGAIIDGIAPEFENIAEGDYEISRSLYFYVKKEHVGVVPGIEEYLTEFFKEGTWGDEGYLSEKGLIPLTQEERKTVKSSAKALNALSM